MRAIWAAAFAFACTPVCPEGDCPSDRDPVDRGDGWNDEIGEGRIYAVFSIQIAFADKGFDLDGRCIEGVCEDNRLGALAFLLNDHIDQAHRSGLGRTLLEVAGAESLTGDDPRATLKSYEAIDLTVPPFPGDDFIQCDPGCARFFVTERSVAGDQARWRSPALIDDGVIRDAGLGSLAFTLPLAQGPRVVSLERPRFEAERIPELDTIDLLLAGAVPAREMASILDPQCIGSQTSCRAQEPTLLDFLVSRGVQPDIDLDGDGLETFRFDPDLGRVSLCFDGCVEGCPHDLPIAPADVDEPWSCVDAASVRDAYSLTLILVATPAFIRGVR